VFFTLFRVHGNNGRQGGCPFGDLVHDWSSNPHDCRCHGFRQLHNSSGNGFREGCHLCGGTFGKCQDLGGDRRDPGGYWFNQGGCVRYHSVNRDFHNMDEFCEQSSQESARLLHCCCVRTYDWHMWCVGMKHWNAHLRWVTNFMMWFMLNWSGLHDSFLCSYYSVDSLVHRFYHGFEMFLESWFVSRSEPFTRDMSCFVNWLENSLLVNYFANWFKNWFTNSLFVDYLTNWFKN